MKISITREEYETFKNKPNPYIRLDMECEYFMEVLATPKRNNPTTRRSPLDRFALSVHAGKRKCKGATRTRAQGHLLSILASGDAMASGEIAEKLAVAMNTTKGNASYIVTKMIQDKVLVAA